MSSNRTATLAIIGGLAVLALVAVAVTVLGGDSEPAPGQGEDHPEVHRVLPLLRGAEDAFDEALGGFEELAECPGGAPGADARTLDEDCVRVWAGLGVEDPGPLLCTYQVDADGLAKAHCDLDADGITAVYTSAPGGEIVRVTPGTAR